MPPAPGGRRRVFQGILDAREPRERGGRGLCASCRQAFRSVEIADTIRSPYVMPYENNIPVWVCRGLRHPMAEIWPEVKHFE